MIIILIVIGISLFIGIKSKTDFDNWLDVILSSIFFGGIAEVLISLFISAIILCGSKYKDDNYSDRTPIVALQDGETVSGTFFLGTGNIDSHITYKYAVNTEEGIKVCQITDKNESVYIKEDSENNIAYFEHFGNKSKSAWLWYFCNGNVTYNKIVFHVPKGTVINDYNIDLK